MLLSLYAAGVILPLAIIVFMIVCLILRGRGQVVLCTECQQCRSACPLLGKGCNPVLLILAAKSGRGDLFVRGGAELCLSCGKCEMACPRGLAPYLEVQKWKDRQKGTEKGAA